MSVQATTGGQLGINFDRVTADAEYSVNMTVIGSDGYAYRYVQANGAIAASQTDVTVSSAGQASDGSGAFVNTTAFADDEYGWVHPAAKLAPDT